MAGCRTCTDKTVIRRERQCRSVPRELRYSTPPMLEPCYPYPRAKCNSCCSGPCGVTCRPVTFEDPYAPFSSPCGDMRPCADTRPCGYYCPSESESGILHTIRNGFQRIFTGGKKRVVCSSGCCEPLQADNVYRYSISQLRNMELCLEKLEDEAFFIDGMIKDALDCDYRINCNDLKCSLNAIMDRNDDLKGDLMCANNCYNPCRDRCEYDTIQALLNRVHCLENLIRDLCIELDYIEFQVSCCGSLCDSPCRKPYCVQPPVCKPNCRKPCCYKPLTCFTKPYCKTACPKTCFEQTVCEDGCRKSCCVKSRGCRGRLVKNLCRTSSAIPVGVMLVKL